MRKIAILPTGVWAEIADNRPLCIYEMSEDAFKEFAASGDEDTSEALCIATYDAAKGFQSESLGSRSPYKLRYGRTFNLGNYENERIELEGDIPHDVPEKEAYQLLREAVLKMRTKDLEPAS